MTGGSHEITHKSLAQILQQIFEMKGCIVHGKCQGGQKTEFNLPIYLATGFQIEYFMLISTGFLKNRALRNEI